MNDRIQDSIRSAENSLIAIDASLANLKAPDEGPPVLLERSSKLVDEIARFEKLKRSAGEANSLQTRAEQLAPVAEKLVASAAVVAMVRKTGIVVPFVPKEGDTLGKRATALLKELREDPNNLVNPRST